MATAPLHSQQAQPVAGVLDVNGRWRLEGEQTFVKAGQKLNAGARLSTASYNYDNSITIVRFSDQTRTRIACENSPKNPCRNLVVVNAPEPTSTSQVSSIITAAFDLLVSHPPAVLGHDSSTISRDQYVVAVREDVVNFDGSQGFSLNGRIPVLPAGIYSVETLGVDGKGPPIKAQISTDANGLWQSSVAVAAPGLYTLTVEDSDGELRASLLILFVNAPQYYAVRQVFDVVRNRTNTWEGVDARTDEDTFLRAMLLALSESR